MAKEVTPRQRKAIEALLTRGSVKEAAEAAGVSRKTVYQWLKRDDFRAALAEAEQEALKALSRTLARLGEKAAAALEQALDDAPAGTKVRAADIVLGRLLQLREIAELEERVAALEKMITQR